MARACGWEPLSAQRGKMRHAYGGDMTRRGAMEGRQREVTYSAHYSYTCYDSSLLAMAILTTVTTCSTARSTRCDSSCTSCVWSLTFS